MAEVAHLAIGDLARLTGTKVNTIRFYEEGGLLPQAERTAAGRRIYRLNAPPRAVASTAMPTQGDWRSFARAGTSGFPSVRCANYSRLRMMLTSPAKRSTASRGSICLR